MNMQNIPRSDKVVKRAFIPKLDAFLMADYMQIELRMLAYYMASCGDESMAEVIRAGKDLHTETARGIYGLPAGVEPSDEQRQVGKVCNFLMVYGGGTPALMKTLNVSYPEAKRILDAFHRTWPGIAVVQAAIKMRLDTRGYITTLWGRHLHPESEHKALNALVQGCSADLMKAAMVKVHRFLNPTDLEACLWGAGLTGGRQVFMSHLVSSVHDELILDCVEHEIPRLVKELPLLMDHPPVSVVVPIGVDIEYSRSNWADKVPYEQKEALLAA